MLRLPPTSPTHSVGLFAVLALTSALQAQPSQPAPTPAHDYRFEVVSIRPTDPPGLNKGSTLHPYSDGHYRQERIYLGGLAAEAFEIKHPYQIQLPSWMSQAWFAVNATLPTGATKADLPVMLRHLLEDRFALKYHHETRQMNGYELVVAKSGPKLIKSAGPPDPSKASGRGFEIENGIPQFDKNGGPTQNSSNGCHQPLGKIRLLPELHRRELICANKR
ncbi:MAG TPA: TIGR03435 family protein [Acidobacteriaceae bacterium]|nr:TIGR03435 family protein [Acidobacteriaceae bacterium]